MKRAYRLQLDLDLALPWIARHLRGGAWTISCEDEEFSPRALVHADVELIERTIWDEPALGLVYHWREKGSVPAYMFTSEEEMVFKLKFCGEEITDQLDDTDA